MNIPLALTTGWLLAVTFLIAWLVERSQKSADSSPPLFNLSIGDKIKYSIGRNHFAGTVYKIIPPNVPFDIPFQINGLPVEPRGKLSETSDIIPTILMTTIEDNKLLLRRAPLDALERADA